jgi:hypothetical protein
LYAVTKDLVGFFDAHGDSTIGGVLSFGYYGDWLALAPQVRKTPSWPRSWANFSLL